MAATVKLDNDRARSYMFTSEYHTDLFVRVASLGDGSWRVVVRGALDEIDIDTEQVTS